METKNSNIQGLGRLAINPTSVNNVGCTDPTAFNYNPNAVVNDGSCIAAVNGCTDPNAVSPTGSGYDASANTDDGSCILYGCVDTDANNFDPNATASHANYPCTYNVYGCIDNEPNSAGGYTMLNYDINATHACNGVDGNHPGFTAIPCVSGLTGDNCCCIETIYGCMDPNADNFLEEANVQAVSAADSTNPCLYTIYGCITANACNFNPGANTQGTGIYVQCAYCNEPGANNFDGYDPNDPTIPLAGCNTGCLGCKVIDNLQEVSGGNPTALEISWEETFATTGAAAVSYYEIDYSDDGTTWTTISNIQPNVAQGVISYTFTVVDTGTTGGLMESTAYNIRVRTVCPAGTSLINPTHSTESDYTTISITTPMVPTYGCTDPIACNYNPLADININTCIYPSGCDDPAYVEYDENVGCPNNANDCITLIVNGCTDPAACNYDLTANVDDASCTYAALNTNCDGTCVLGYVDDGTGNCVACVYGCMDPTMFNYDALATCSPLLGQGAPCQPFTSGCTDATAINFNTSANQDDGSCYYDMLSCSDSSNCGDVENLVNVVSYPTVITVTNFGFNLDYLVSKLEWNWAQNTSTGTPTKFETQFALTTGDGDHGNFTSATNYPKNFNQSTVTYEQTISWPIPVGGTQVSVGDWVHYRTRWKYIDTFSNEYYGPWNDYWAQVQ